MGWPVVGAGARQVERLRVRSGRGCRAGAGGRTLVVYLPLPERHGPVCVLETFHCRVGQTAGCGRRLP